MVNCIKTYVVDIDGTICTQMMDGKYENAQPLLERIAKINALYEDGHCIVFFTARGMGRFKGDVNKCYETFYDLTKKQLETWSVKFHNLVLGKINADYFIDDKGVNADDFFSRNT